MSKVYFTSDLHFGHKNICERVRGMDVEENIQHMIKTWNSTVTKKDIVYILGDVTMENRKYLDLLKELNGTIYIIGGNHDDRRICKKLHEMGIIVMGCVEHKGFICTHIPVHPKEVAEYRGNIHGHIHKIYHGKEASINELGEDYYNVNCELHEYKPVDIDEIIKYFNKRRIRKILQYLQDSGWSDLIDGRWKDNVVVEIKQNFPKITDDVIEEVCKIVIV